MYKLLRKGNNYKSKMYYFCSTIQPSVQMNRTIEITRRSSVFVGRADELLPELLPDKRVIAISDSNIDRCHHQLLSPYEHILIGIGEQSKTLVTVERVFRALMEMNADRNCFILGIGGGIVTDVAGFVASTYMRGVDFGFVSTTLLGQVDASIGGKNGVNVSGYKNIAGSFNQPHFVVCDVAMLSTLSDREFRAGLAEIIKTAIIGDEPLFRLLENTEFERLRKDEALLRRIVESAVRVKAAIVAADERESGMRRKLNLGHTIAHAIEKSIRGINHGEAVAIGLKFMSSVAERMGVIDNGDAGRIASVLDRFGFDTALPADMRKLLKAIRKDKKRDGDSLHLIVPAAIGDVRDYTFTFGEVEALFL